MGRLALRSEFVLALIADSSKQINHFVNFEAELRGKRKRRGMDV